ncbi:TetR/AcrR family transcriptional regulator [Rhizobium sp. 9140]|uniref:TetR/AcrR family transcriptional regulator n=1 Tax=Rhizobium sp. 9140 TaxID=1761900 RepID=UPI0007914153|nr:TetR/AcrR family transcriptional regulator [Rhizobium sp. 9140]CZT37248.1 transcriptional regulator, TetR family [Rhizobium sp. 9140]
MEQSRTLERQGTTAKRLSKAERRRQLLDTALLIVREEGADRLTLGHLAVRAGVSKPVAYDHFETRSELLIALYRWIDTQKVDAFRDAMSGSQHSGAETAGLLAAAYIQCAADIDGEFHAIGAALAGSEEKAAVFQELLAHSVAMFVAVLAPHSRLPSDELKRRCVGLVGAGEALAAAKLRGDCDEGEAIATFTGIIDGAVRSAEPS